MKLGFDAVYSLCAAYGVYITVRGHINWKDLSPDDRAEVATTMSLTKMGIRAGVDIYSFAKSSDASIADKLNALNRLTDQSFDESKTVGKILAKMKTLDPKFAEQANAWIKRYVGWDKSGTAADVHDFELIDPTGKWIVSTFGFLGDTGKIVGEILGPVTAAAALALSIYSLFRTSRAPEHSKSPWQPECRGRHRLSGLRRIDMDVTVIGIVLVTIALIATAVVALVARRLGRHKPLSPPDDYMQNVVFPFEAQVPGAGLEADSGSDLGRRVPQQDSGRPCLWSICYRLKGA